jgi:hypothetical protein
MPVKIETPTRALSIPQGWAWAIVAGFKPVENRTWKTSYRGWIAIHASTAARSLDASEEVIRAACPDVEEIFDDPAIDDTHQLWQLGAIIGVAELCGCCPYDMNGPQRPWLEICRRAVVKSRSSAGDAALLAFSEGPYCFLLRGALEFSRPIPAGGKLNLWNLTPTQRQQVAVAIREAQQRPAGQRPPLWPPVWVHPRSEYARARAH